MAEGYKRVGRIRELKRNLKAELYEMGCLLRDFYDDESWRLLDLKGEDGEAVEYKTFEAFVQGEAEMSYSLAMEMIAVVRAFPPEMARQVGMNKLYAVVMITRATKEDDKPHEVLDEHPELRDLSVKELERRAKAIRDGLETVDGRPTDAAKLVGEIAAELERLLRNRGADGATVKPHASSGEWWLTCELRVGDVKALRGRAD